MFEILIIFNSKKNFFAVLGFEVRAYTLSHSTSPFLVEGFFRDRVSQNYFPRLASISAS
jgi:hypothetical protein